MKTEWTDAELFDMSAAQYCLDHNVLFRDAKALLMADPRIRAEAMGRLESLKFKGGVSAP